MKDVIDIIILSAFIVLSGVIAIEVGIITSVVELMAGMAARLMIDYNLISFQMPDIISVLANIGVLTLMYLAGLEIDFPVLSSKLKKSVVMGVSSFIFPFIAILLFGLIAAPLFIPLNSEQALLSAIIVSSTSVSIIYPILIKRGGGKLGEEEKLILGTAMVGELVTIFFWSFFFLKLSWSLAAFIIFLFAFALMFPYLGRKIFSRFKGNVSEFEFKIILLMLLVITVLSEEAGAEGAIIAFVLGMVTSGVVIEHENLFVKLRGIVFGFFAPIFFFKVGLGINLLSFLQNIYAILLIISFTVIAFLATYYSSQIVGRFIAPDIAKYTAKIFNSNLTLGLIIAVFGYDSGIINQELYFVLVGVLLIMTLSSSIMVREKASLPNASPQA